MGCAACARTLAACARLVRELVRDLCALEMSTKEMSTKEMSPGQAARGQSFRVSKMSKVGKGIEGLQIACPRVSRDYREPCATVAIQEPERLEPGAESRHCRDHSAVILQSFCTDFILQSFCSHFAVVLQSFCSQPAVILKSFCRHSAIILQ